MFVVVVVVFVLLRCACAFFAIIAHDDGRRTLTTLPAPHVSYLDKRTRACQLVCRFRPGASVATIGRHDRV